MGGPAHQAAVSANAAAMPIATGWPFIVAVFLGLQAVVYTIDGWDGVIYFGEEVREPARYSARDFGSVFSIMGIYLLLNLVALYILPMKEIAGNTFVLGTVADRIFGSLGDPIIRSIMVISMLSCLNANQLFCSRTLHAMSCDGLFFRRAAKVNVGGTPAFSLLLSTIAGIIFVLGSFERVIAMLSFFFVANYTLTYTSLFVLRKKSRRWIARIARGAIRGRPLSLLLGPSCFSSAQSRRPRQRSVGAGNARAELSRVPRDEICGRPRNHDIAAIFQPRNPFSPLFRLRIWLAEKGANNLSAGLGIRAGHVEAAKGMRADHRAGAFAVQIEIADVEGLLGFLDFSGFLE